MIFQSNKSIRIFPDGFSFYKKNKGNEEEVKQTFTGSSSTIASEAPYFFELDENQTEDIQIIVATVPPVLIPKPLFQAEKMQDYLKFQFETAEIGKSFSDEIESYRSIYFLDQKAVNALKRLNINTHYVHEITLLLKDGIKRSQSRNFVLLSLNKSFADFIVWKDEKLMMVNRFNFTSEIDMLFYLLHVIQQFDMKETSCKIYLNYFIERNPKLITLLNTYIGDMEIVSVDLK
ncbi:MAG: DUF3822 family protein [Bacteroidales bacterium]